MSKKLSTVSKKEKINKFISVINTNDLNQIESFFDSILEEDKKDCLNAGTNQVFYFPGKLYDESVLKYFYDLNSGLLMPSSSMVENKRYDVLDFFLKMFPVSEHYFFVLINSYAAKSDLLGLEKINDKINLNDFLNYSVNNNKNLFYNLLSNKLTEDTLDFTFKYYPSMNLNFAKKLTLSLFKNGKAKELDIFLGGIKKNKDEIFVDLNLIEDFYSIQVMNNIMDVDSSAVLSKYNLLSDKSFEYTKNAIFDMGGNMEKFNRKVKELFEQFAIDKIGLNLNKLNKTIVKLINYGCYETVELVLDKSGRDNLLTSENKFEICELFLNKLSHFDSNDNKYWGSKYLNLEEIDSLYEKYLTENENGFYIKRKEILVRWKCENFTTNCSSEKKEKSALKI